MRAEGGRGNAVTSSETNDKSSIVARNKVRVRVPGAVNPGTRRLAGFRRGLPPWVEWAGVAIILNMKVFLLVQERPSK